MCVWRAAALTHAASGAHVPTFGQLDVLVGNNGPNVVGNSGAANELHRNEGGGVFSAVSGTSITQGSAWTYSVAWGDYDGDGDVRRRRTHLEPPPPPPCVCGVRPL